MVSFLERRTAVIGRFLTGSAWFMIVASLLLLGWVIASLAADPASPVALSAVAGQIGLVYDGRFGIGAAVFQGVAIATAALFTLLPVTRPRRIGHATLVVWSGWWAYTLCRVASLEPALDSVSQASVLMLLFVATLYRAAWAWRPHVAPAPAEVEPPMIRSDAARASDYNDLKTDVAPAERFMLRVRDVSSNGSVPRLSKRGVRRLGAKLVASLRSFVPKARGAAAKVRRQGASAVRAIRATS